MKQLLLSFCLFISVSLCAQTSLTCDTIYNLNWSVLGSNEEFILNDGSFNEPYQPNQNCLSEIKFGNDATVCVELIFNSFDLGLGDTLRIYEGGYTCEDNWKVYEYTSQNNPSGIWQLWRSGFWVEFISDNENEGGGWEFELIPWGGHCEFPGINPKILSELGEPIVNSPVFVDNLWPGDTAFTFGNGYSHFSYWGAVLYPDTAEVIPLSHDDYLNGVTTLDIVKIKKHILGTEILDSNYKMIAADVNLSGTISTLDLVQINKLILGIQDSFPAVEPWRFVHKCSSFEEGFWDFTERVQVTGQFPNPIPHFIGVKMGDVNNSANLELD